jgi:hypothetical protein
MDRAHYYSFPFLGGEFNFVGNAACLPLPNVPLGIRTCTRVRGFKVDSLARSAQTNCKKKKYILSPMVELLLQLLKNLQQQQPR